MSSEKPRTETKHPDRESHVPKEKKPKKHRLRNAALGVAAAVGLGALATGGCAPSARAQETTPSAGRPVAAQTTPSAAAESRRPYPPTVVAQATTPTARTSTYDQAAVGGPLPAPEGRLYTIDVSTEQPVTISAESARSDYLPMFENRFVQSMQTLGEEQTFNAGDWEVQSTQYDEIVIRNRSAGYEVSSTTSIGSKVGILPFPETEYAKGPMLFIAGDGYAQIFYLNKITGKVGYCLFGYDVFHGQPEIGTDVYNGEPYIVAAAPGSIRNGDISPGTRLFQFVLAVTERDRDAPAAGTTYNLRE